VQVFQGVDSISGGPEAASLSSGLPTGAFVGITPAISFGTGHGPKLFGASTGAALRRYADTGDVSLVDVNAALGAQFTGRHSGLRVRQTIARATYYQFLPVLPVPGGESGVLGGADSGADRAAYNRPITTSFTTADFGRQISRRMMLSANYAWQYRH